MARFEVSNAFGTTTLVQTEISQELLDGLPIGKFVQILMVTGG